VAAAAHDFKPMLRDCPKFTRVLTHPDLDGWISLNRTGESQKLAHGDFISTHKAGIPQKLLQLDGILGKLYESLSYPHRRRSDRFLRPLARIDTATASQPAGAFHRDVVLTENLATQPNARQTFRRQHRLLGLGHLIRLTGNELDTARRASSVSPACVKLIHLGLISKG
jgi:hypothetical protein